MTVIEVEKKMKPTLGSTQNSKGRIILQNELLQIRTMKMFSTFCDLTNFSILYKLKQNQKEGFTDAKGEVSWLDQYSWTCKGE